MARKKSYVSPQDADKWLADQLYHKLDTWYKSVLRIQEGIENMEFGGATELRVVAEDLNDAYLGLDQAVDSFKDALKKIARKR